MKKRPVHEEACAAGRVLYKPPAQRAPGEAEPQTGAEGLSAPLARTHRHGRGGSPRTMAQTIYTNLQKPGGFVPRLRRVVPLVAAALLYTLLLVGLFANAGAAARPGAALSLRYDVPLDGAVAAGVNRAILRSGEPVRFSATFWGELRAETLTGPGGEAETPVLYLDGAAEEVLPARFVQGGYPAPLEAKGVAVSEGLAWKLLGSVDAVGLTLNWREETYTVRGVMQGEQPLLVVQLDAQSAPGEGFSAVELVGLEAFEAAEGGDVRETGLAFAEAVGLSGATTVVVPGTLPGAMRAMAWLPLVLLCLWLLWHGLKLLRTAAFWHRQLLWLCLLMLAAVLLPRAMARLPGWMIPSQWSNLAHWADLLGEMGHRADEWLWMRPGLCDVLLKKQLVWQGLLLVLCLFVLGYLLRRFMAQGQQVPPYALRMHPTTGRLPAQEEAVRRENGTAHIGEVCAPPQPRLPQGSAPPTAALPVPEKGKSAEQC